MRKRNESRKTSSATSTFPKCPTGIQGLDEITQGGVPRGRPTLVCGSAGSGKKVLGMEFLVRGATKFNEPGVFMAFEETEEDLFVNFESLGFDLPKLVKDKKIAIDHVFVDCGEIEETGEYDLEGLFIRLAMAIDEVKAKRVVLDTVEALFSGLTNEGILRAELRRLFRWLKDRGVTAVITAEQGMQTFARHGLEEYVADCVIVMDHRIAEQISTRRLRIAKYRGSAHGQDEYPFLISSRGISLLPVTSLGLDYKAPADRVSSGIDRLDTMLEGKGYYRGSTILVSGTAGRGKTSLGAHYVNSACSRGERVGFIAFEESPDQIIRDMRSIGIDLRKWVRKGLLKFHASRPTMHGLESHLIRIHRFIEEFQPVGLVLDPITNLVSVGNVAEVKGMLMRLVDFFKMNKITCICTSLTRGGRSIEQTEVAISSLIDTWILLRTVESEGERDRSLYVAKSRGMDHSDQIREFRFTSHGIEIADVYLGAGGLTGAARMASEDREEAEALVRRQEVERKRRELERKRIVFEARLAALKAQFEAEEEEIQMALDERLARMQTLANERQKESRRRKANNT